MFWLLSFLILMLGASIASFSAVLAYRLPRHLPWIKARSQCDHCQRQLFFWENVPIFGYLLLAGRCRTCHTKIPFEYFCWELLLGLWFVVWWWLSFFTILNSSQNFKLISGLTIISFCLLFFGSVLIWTSIIDWKTQTITNFWLKFLGLLTSFYLIIMMLDHQLSWVDLIIRLLVALILGCSFWGLNQLSQKIWHKDGLGSGDAYLILILASWLTPWQSLVTILLAFWSGALVGIYLLITKKAHCHQLAFIPFLVFGFFGAYFFGNYFWQWLF